MVIAHAKWFIEDPARYPPHWGNLLDPATLMLLFGVGLAVALTGLALRRVPAGLLPSVGVPPRITVAVPRLLAASVGLALPLLAAQERLLIPSASLSGVPGAPALAVAEALVGLWLLTAWGPRAAAAALGLLCAAFALIHGPLALLEAAYVPGIALYLALTRPRGPADEPPSRSLASSILALALGGSLIVVAFTEKLLAPDLGLAVVHAHPSLDVLATIGVQTPDGAFVRLAGAGEVLLGLLIATGIGGRLVPLGALLPFLATVSIFGGEELVGHLPI